MRYVRRYPDELPQLAELLPRISTPVTVISGRNDRVVPLPTRSSSTNAYPTAASSILDSGHFAWEETPTEYAAIIVEAVQSARS